MSIFAFINLLNRDENLYKNDFINSTQKGTVVKHFYIVEQRKHHITVDFKITFKLLSNY
jgi:hypothetical protein